MWHGSFSLLAFPELLHLNRHGSWCWLKFLSPCKRTLGLNFSMTLGRHFYHRFLICLFPRKWNLLTCSQGKVDPSPRQPSVLLPQVTLASLQSVVILFRFESNTPGSQVPGTTFIKLSKWFLWILPFFLSIFCSGLRQQKGYLNTVLHSHTNQSCLIGYYKNPPFAKLTELLISHDQWSYPWSSSLRRQVWEDITFSQMESVRQTNTVIFQSLLLRDWCYPEIPSKNRKQQFPNIPVVKAILLFFSGCGANLINNSFHGF